MGIWHQIEAVVIIICDYAIAYRSVTMQYNRPTNDKFGSPTWPDQLLFFYLLSLLLFILLYSFNYISFILFPALFSLTSLSFSFNINFLSIIIMHC